MRALFAVLILPLFALAAPPQVDWHFPMGAQRGTDLNATIGGKHSWPLQVWCEHGAVQFTATQKKGTFSVQCSAVLIVCILQFYVMLYCCTFSICHY